MRDVILQGDVFEKLKELPDESVDCVVTSPPYWALRDYGFSGQIGLEPTVQEYVDKMVAVFREVRRVLKNEGTLWLNLGDTYAGSGKGQTKDGAADPKVKKTQGMKINASVFDAGLKPKDLVGVPWRVAFALQADGWYLRQDIIWAKPNPMPESVRDRCTKSHEYIFMLSKSAKYYYDADAIKEKMKYSDLKGQDASGYKDATRYNGKHALTKPAGWANGNDHSSIAWATEQNQGRKDKQRGHSRTHAGFNERWDQMSKKEQSSYGRNKRDVWTVATFPFPEAHFATYPPDLIRPCVRAACPPEGIVLDPFFGSGTTGLVAKQEDRSFIGIELNVSYVDLALRRLKPLLEQQKVTRYA